MDNYISYNLMCKACTTININCLTCQFSGTKPFCVLCDNGATATYKYLLPDKSNCTSPYHFIFIIIYKNIYFIFDKIILIYRYLYFW